MVIQARGLCYRSPTHAAGPTPQANPRLARERPAIRLFACRLGIVLLGVGLALGLAELYLRLALPTSPAVRLPMSYDLEALDLIARGEAYLAFDAELGWQPRPAADARIDGSRYTHNQAGLRAPREYAPSPGPGIRRFAAFGDSFTYCQEVSIGNCWTEQLAEELPATEVLNYGVPGYAPDQAWLRYRRLGASTSPCAVLIGHMVENVNRVVNRFRPFYEPKTGIPLGKPRFGLDGDQLRLLGTGAEGAEQFRDPRWVETQLGPHDAWYYPGTFVANPLDGLFLSRLTRTAFYQTGDRHDGMEWTPAWAARMYRPGSEPFEVLLGVLSGFAADVRAAGASPVVLIFPSKDEVEAARDGHARTHQPLVDALARLDVATVDLTDSLGRFARSNDISRVFQGHYTRFANARIARTLADQLPALTSRTCGQ